MMYISTRDKTKKVSGAQAIIEGIAPDGGLYVPESIPKLSEEDFNKLLGMSYVERAAFIMQKYLPEFTNEELMETAEKAYDRFDGDPAPLVKIDNRLFMLELWHGPTHAFKDMALTVLPRLITLSKQKLGIKDTTYILVATSGDTGKAALEGFKDVDGTRIAVFYPVEGVSQMQKLQMATQQGDNVAVFAVKGNFDDCQTAVKTVFADADANNKLKEKGFSLSSANSINWGRLLPQIVYYVSAYLDLLGENQLDKNDKINFCVPTGNFGNILAGYYAKLMGVPVNKLLCASNSNNVLTDFFNKSEYNSKREFIKTVSPSMDILISSNLERLIFEFSDRDDELTASRMNQLKSSGKYTITEKESAKLKEVFFADYLNEDDTIETIQDFFDEHSYPLDTHTGVAVGVNNKYTRAESQKVKTVIVSTASPYKFPQDVLFAITGDYCSDAFRAAKKLYKVTAMDIPESVLELKTLPQRFKAVLSNDKIIDAVLEV